MDITPFPLAVSIVPSILPSSSPSASTVSTALIDTITSVLSPSSAAGSTNVPPSLVTITVSSIPTSLLTDTLSTDSSSISSSSSFPSSTAMVVSSSSSSSSTVVASSSLFAYSVLDGYFATFWTSVSSWLTTLTTAASPSLTNPSRSGTTSGDSIFTPVTDDYDFSYERVLCLYLFLILLILFFIQYCVWTTNAKILTSIYLFPERFRLSRDAQYIDHVVTGVDTFVAAQQHQVERAADTVDDEDNTGSSSNSSTLPTDGTGKRNDTSSSSSTSTTNNNKDNFVTMNRNEFGYPSQDTPDNDSLSQHNTFRVPSLGTINSSSSSTYSSSSSGLSTPRTPRGGTTTDNHPYLLHLPSVSYPSSIIQDDINFRTPHTITNDGTERFSTNSVAEETNHSSIKKRNKNTDGLIHRRKMKEST